MQIDTVPSDSIVFISAPAGQVNGVYGGLMSLRAQWLGAKGTVVDGRVRDLQEHRDLNYPVGRQSPGRALKRKRLADIVAGILAGYWHKRCRRSLLPVTDQRPGAPQ